MQATSVTFRIRRWRPRSKAQYWQEYSVSVNAHMTILDGLEIIRTQQDSTLLYRHSCHHSSCGTCAMRINGEEKLACITNILALETALVTLEPLPGFRLCGDLVVDMGTLYHSIEEEWDYLMPAQTNAATAFPEGVQHYTRFENCIECGCCISVCPVAAQAGQFQGPAALAMLNRQRLKHPSQQEYLIAKAGQPDGASACQRHIACSKSCPNSVAPARHIMDLKKLIS